MKKFILVLFSTFLVFQSSYQAYAISPTNKNRHISQNAIERNYVAIAKRILKGEIYVSTYFPFYKPTKPINWKEDPFHNKTWRLFYHSLDELDFLTEAYETTGDKRYLQFGYQVIQSYWEANKDPKKATDYFAWSSHTMANRTNNLVNFYQYYSKTGTKSERLNLYAIIQKHGEYLNNASYYDQLSNHGIFQDIALYSVAKYFPNMPNTTIWKSNALYRTKMHIKNDFTEDGLHKEHSPNYQLLILSLIERLNKMANDKDLSTILLKAQKAFSYTVESDFSIPRLGDTDTLTMPKTTDYRQLDPNFEYVITKGQRGTQPPLVTNISNAIGMIRSGWGQGTTTAILSANTQGIVHKHADDLSFLLTVNGKDIFTDSGKYNYNTYDPYQIYLRTTFAHNMITVDDKSYPLVNENIGKSKLTKVIETDESVLMEGEHTLYSDVTVKRTVIYLKRKNIFLIHDQIISDAVHKTNQIFNLGRDVVSQKIDNDTYLLDNLITLKQHKPSISTEYFGQKFPLRGWGSSDFNVLYPIKQLDFAMFGTYIEYFTSISMSSLVVTNFDFENGYYSITLSDGSVQTIQSEIE